MEGRVVMNLNEILREATNRNASDIFLVPGAPVTLKLNGGQEKIGEEKLIPPTIGLLVDEIYDVSHRTRTNLDNNIDDDFSFSISDLGRFRVNVFRQRGSLAAVIRVIHFGRIVAC